MPRASSRKCGPARPRRSSRRRIAEEGTLARIHRVRRELEARRLRLGLSHREDCEMTLRELRAKGHPV